ncbi:MAG: DNA mismatch repair endonuclease MutL [Prevotella sp.]|nr:DNA mismatch repair endonuclease MutL [Prevotella sp.]
MSDIIQLLPDSVANQIAAGEVIQRPASVIKELVENAVDAGAKNINVLVIDAGRTTIQVIDDGCGMSETDARLAFERHATSKIRKADDLFSLQTMGFRGEALPSIAAVAQVELRTRQQGEDLGTLLSISGSKVVGQEVCSCPVGSNFKIENLFFNVPARRKFLKSNATELNNIISAFERIVLVYPKITFTLHSNGAELFNLRATNLRQRIIDVFGKRFNQDLLSVEADTSLCHISGYVGKPESAKKKGAHQFFFVNGRYMRHPYFHKAVQNAFERLVPVGDQVPYFLYFRVPAENIDVNIHPTKTEIKFENEQAIWQILTTAVKEAVGLFSEVPAIDFDTEGKPEIPLFNPSGKAEMPKVNYNPQYNPFENGKKARQDRKTEDWQQLYDSLIPSQTVQPQLFDEKSSAFLVDCAPTHYQYKGKYIMTAVKSGLMIIDQHRAHVRILYEEYINRRNHQQPSAQKMLFPEMIQLTAAEDVVLQSLREQMTDYGFELTDLGAHSYAVNSIPVGLEGVNPVALVRDIIVAAQQEEASPLHEAANPLSLNLARHAAVPYGQILTNEEMENIINSLFACSNVNYTPDGKKILYIFPQQDLEQLLG